MDIFNPQIQTVMDMFKPFKDLVSNGTEGWRMKGLQLLPRKLHEEVSDLREY